MNYMVREKQIIECVPNFSEGRNKEVIKQITDVVEQMEGVKLLDVDPGEATNRTVVTFVGEPSVVVETAFRCVQKAAQLIDMRQHHSCFGYNSGRVCRTCTPAGRTHCQRAESTLLLLRSSCQNARAQESCCMPQGRV